MAYINFKNNGIAEDGGAAALRGDKQHIDATVSTLVLCSELDRGTGLSFNGGNAPFVVNSMPVSLDGMVLKVSAEVAVNENATLSLGYGVLLLQNHQNNSVSADFTWRF